MVGSCEIWAFQRIERAKAAAAQADPRELISSPEQLIAKIVEEFDFEDIAFNAEAVRRTDVSAAGTVQHPEQAATVIAPMTGDVSLLHLRAMRSRSDLPHA